MPPAAKIITFKQLLNLAHDKGLTGITTEPLKVEEGYAYFRAIVTLEVDGKVQTYSGHADATTKNVAPAMQNCLPRMAETRSIVRALRLAVNVGEVAAEELADYNEAQPRSGGGVGAGQNVNLINNTGQQCASCRAPHGKPHLRTCPTLKQSQAA